MNRNRWIPLLLCFGMVFLTAGASYGQRNAVTEHESTGEQQVVYTDMLNAYNDNRLTEARRLAKKHIMKSSDMLDTAKIDFDRESQVRLTIGIINSMLNAENKMNAGDRLGGDAGLFRLVTRTLLKARNTSALMKSANEPVKTYIKNELGAGAQRLIHAGSAIVTREELSSIFNDFKQELNKKGFQNLDSVINEKMPSVPSDERFLSVNEAEAVQIISAVKNYFNGLIKQDSASIRSATGADAQAEMKLMDSYRKDLREEGIESIRSVALPALSKKNLKLQKTGNGFHGLIIKGIKLDVVKIDGTTASMEIDKHLRLKKNTAGKWIIVVPRGN